MRCWSHLALRTSDLLGVPVVFAVATALPVIAFALIMVTGIAKVGSAVKAAEKFEYWTRRIVGVFFIGIGAYLLAAMLIAWSSYRAPVCDSPCTSSCRISILIETGTFIHRHCQQLFKPD